MQLWQRLAYAMPSCVITLKRKALLAGLQVYLNRRVPRIAS